jgi:hypothetical protein
MTLLNRIAQEPWQTKALLYLAWCAACMVALRLFVAVL